MSTLLFTPKWHFPIIFGYSYYIYIYQLSKSTSLDEVNYTKSLAVNVNTASVEHPQPDTSSLINTNGGDIS